MKPERYDRGGDILTDIAYGIERDAFLDEVGQVLVRNAALGCDDEFTRGMIRNRVNYLRVQELFGHAVPFRLPRLCHGDVLLGEDIYGSPVALWSKLLCSGLLLAGTTGSSKTGLLMSLAPEIARSGARLWLFDMHKRQLRHLRPVFHGIGQEMMVLQAKNLKLNPMHPGHREPRGHLTTFVDQLNRTLDVGERGQSILWQSAYALYDKFGVWRAGFTEAPCPFDLYEHVRETRAYNPSAREAILDRLGALLSFAPCFAYRVGWDPVALEKFSIIFEMRGTPEQVTRMVIEPCLHAVFQDAYERGAVNAPLSLVIALEDSLRLLVGNHSSDGKIASLDEIVALTRGSGKTVFPVVQGVHGLSRSLVCNLNTKIMGLMGSHDDYQILGADMRLNPEQLLWAKRNLRPGVFVAQINQGDWREPFVLSVPKPKLAAMVDDAEAALSVKVLDSLPTVPAKEYEHWKPHHVIEVAVPPPKASPHLTEVELRYLKLVVTEPAKASSHYAKEAGLNGAAAAAVRAKLSALGYVREHSIATGRRGRMAIVLEPLERAREVI